LHQKGTGRAPSAAVQTDFFLKSLDHSLSELLALLKTASDLSTVADQFLTLTETSNLFDCSRPVKKPRLVLPILSLIKLKFQVDFPISRVVLVHYPAKDFFHGSGQALPCQLTFFCFRRERTGFCIFVDETGVSQFLRISLSSASPGSPGLN